MPGCCRPTPCVTDHAGGDAGWPIASMISAATIASDARPPTCRGSACSTVRRRSSPCLGFGAALGGACRVWIKREDLLPIGLGGNKLRNLEFLIGAASPRAPTRS